MIPERVRQKLQCPYGLASEVTYSDFCNILPVTGQHYSTWAKATKNRQLLGSTFLSLYEIPGPATLNPDTVLAEL